MALSERGARLWHALELGPLWRERAAAANDGGADGGVESGVDGGADDRVDDSTGDRGVTGAQRGAGVAAMGWEALEQAVAGCTACGLCRTRTQTVFGVGDRGARWLFIGEAPGAEEDARGEPFVGQAGRLLDNMLAEAGLGRDRDGDAAVFIANVLKCRPPGNRNPAPGEVAACDAYLRRQIALLDPELIVVMGRFAAQSLLRTEAALASLRGRVHEYAAGVRRYPVIVTYHPAYLLRNLADKARSWEDLCLARATFARLSANGR